MLTPQSRVLEIFLISNTRVRVGLAKGVVFDGEQLLLHFHILVRPDAQNWHPAGVGEVEVGVCRLRQVVAHTIDDLAEEGVGEEVLLER